MVDDPQVARTPEHERIVKRLQRHLTAGLKACRPSSFSLFPSFSSSRQKSSPSSSSYAPAFHAQLEALGQCESELTYVDTYLDPFFKVLNQTDGHLVHLSINALCEFLSQHWISPQHINVVLEALLDRRLPGFECMSSSSTVQVAFSRTMLQIWVDPDYFASACPRFFVSGFRLLLALAFDSMGNVKAGDRQMARSGARSACLQMVGVLYHRYEISFRQDSAEHLSEKEALVSDVFSLLCQKASSQKKNETRASSSDEVKEELDQTEVLEDDLVVVLPLSPKEIHMMLDNQAFVLGLVTTVLKKAGPAFGASTRLIQIVKQDLCHIILQNCTCPYPTLVSASLEIFMALMQTKVLKKQLRAEIETFLQDVFLVLISSPNHHSKSTTLARPKQLVLEVFQMICQDRAVVAEIFLNYDCDWHSIHCFREIVHALAKLAASYPSFSVANHAKNQWMMEEQECCIQAMQCLVQILANLNSDKLHFHQQRSSKTTTSAAQVETTPKHHDSPDMPTPAISSVVQTFDRKRRLEEEWTTGLLKFNHKPKAGLAYLVAKGHLELTPESLATFFHTRSRELNKTVVGELLGREEHYAEGLWYQTMHAYVDLMAFHELDIDVAIRVFLAGFRLPGEAQKIDRLMEKFAKCYCRHNPHVFEQHVDTAYVLSFSIIMLQTDLHNPSIREDRKMTREGFIRNNRGIGVDGTDVSRDFLAGIYDRIKDTPISLKDDHREEHDEVEPVDPSMSAFSIETFTQQSKRRKQHIMRQTFAENGGSDDSTSLVSSSDRKNPRNDDDDEEDKKAKSVVPEEEEEDYPFFVIDEEACDHIRPMFDICWAPILAQSGVMFNALHQDQPMDRHNRLLACCLEGLRHAIHLSCVLGLVAERQACVSTLIQWSGICDLMKKNLQPKHLGAIDCMFDIALAEGNRLGPSWSLVLGCVVELSKLDDKLLEVDPESLDRRNARLLCQKTHHLQMIERVFSSSIHLTDESWLEFISLCCNLSSGSQMSKHHFFSLQKVVEVMDMNLTCRSPRVWLEAWRCSIHVVFVPLVMDDSAPDRSVFAINAIRQLQIKWFSQCIGSSSCSIEAKGGGSDEHEILRPLITIFRHPQTSTFIQEICIHSMESILRLGWTKGWTVLLEMMDHLQSTTVESNNPNVVLCMDTCWTSLMSSCDIKRLVVVAEGLFPLQALVRACVSHLIAFHSPLMIEALGHLMEQSLDQSMDFLPKILIESFCTLVETQAYILGTRLIQKWCCLLTTFVETRDEVGGVEQSNFLQETLWTLSHELVHVLNEQFDSEIEQFLLSYFKQLALVFYHQWDSVWSKHLSMIITHIFGPFITSPNYASIGLTGLSNFILPMASSLHWNDIHTLLNELSHWTVSSTNSPKSVEVDKTETMYGSIRQALGFQIISPTKNQALLRLGMQVLICQSTSIITHSPDSERVVKTFLLDSCKPMVFCLRVFHQPNVYLYLDLMFHLLQISTSQYHHWVMDELKSELGSILNRSSSSSSLVEEEEEDNIPRLIFQHLNRWTESQQLEHMHWIYPLFLVGLNQTPHLISRELVVFFEHMIQPLVWKQLQFT